MGSVRDMKPQIGRYPLSNDDPLVEHLAAAADRLRSKLTAVDTRDLGISDYSCRYFEGTLVNGLSKLNLYAFLILLSLRRSDGAHALPATGIIDYGGGNGLLSLLAREAGFGTVVYTDIDAGSAHDARRLASRLEMEADHYVVGDLDGVTEYMRANTIQCQAMCSYDVIEHVYDIEGFLRAIPAVASGPLRAVMGSGANAANPRIRRALMRLQRRVELEDRAPEFGHKQRDSIGAYARIRADMIRGVAPDLPPDAVATLTSLTRGRASADIEVSVQRYLETGALPPPPDHPTNTCDPNTGNWAEHLMNAGDLADVLTTVGLQARVVPGYYNPYLGWKGSVASILNQAIRVSGRQGLRLAPYYVLVGERD